MNPGFVPGFFIGKQYVMKRYMLGWIVLLVIGACSNEEAGEQWQDLQEEVIAVHDEVMPKMGAIAAWSDSLRQLQNQLQSEASAADSALTEAIEEQLLQLAKAEESMMDWMRNYTPPTKEQAEEEIMAYLQEEQQKINAVRDDMLAAIADAKAFFANHKNRDDTDSE